VVPGISAALGAAAGARIPLTHRDCASSVTFSTGHSSDGRTPAALSKGTLVVYMGLARLEETCERLVAEGRAPATPAAVVSRATLADEQIVVGDLSDIAHRARRARLTSPALLIVGEVVARRVAVAEPAAQPRASVVAS
jgi:uroporphyrin-III C-methyltransferase/precorrin-2 dehydrogenase/sirohydrochlorin ferrochelatase